MRMIAYMRLKHVDELIKKICEIANPDAIAMDAIKALCAEAHREHVELNNEIASDYIESSFLPSE